MNGFDIPTIDISPYLDDANPNRKAVVPRKIDAAARTVGFVQIVGHGVASGLSDQLADAMDKFFSRDIEYKKMLQSPTNRGYTPPKSERLALSLGVDKAHRLNDFFEAFNVGSTRADYPGADLDSKDYPENAWPNDSDGFRAAAEAWFSQMTVTSTLLMQIFANALSLEPGYFDPYLDHSRYILRLNNYALPVGEKVTVDNDLIGVGEHTDFGIFTILWADDVKGLQVLGPDHTWRDVSPAPGALLINFGDAMARWTNDTWRSTLHRVKPPIIDNVVRRRRSAAFFTGGNVDAVIAPLPSLVPAGTSPLYPPITIGQHINHKLRGAQELVVNTDGTDRESSRALAAND
ncbi:isopenicillin N synthase family dioxygenase [Mycobacterium stomatepiae]|uniref:2OG-Fe(II) oxygenase n=1 Tax=Mycobacterium stomatepiae TaxID=470076 RepID=A0A7I7QDN6_9MYCO|nr:isopenicillin N synthase family oxygenase [Mycobacterium stomatepiae]MCV7164971.1 isopenicillin N synthase family oxygenase [Mycobacterium stomatepiae]BBY24157.1 2OG-Fe(II) oxygenase [Mycobacterium stomatepiae]